MVALPVSQNYTFWHKTIVCGSVCRCADVPAISLGNVLYSKVSYAHVDSGAQTHTYFYYYYSPLCHHTAIDDRAANNNKEKKNRNNMPGRMRTMNKAKTLSSINSMMLDAVLCGSVRFTMPDDAFYDYEYDANAYSFIHLLRIGLCFLAALTTITIHRHTHTHMQPN